MFGQRLKELRLSNGYTQATLADKIGVSEKTIGTWERGTREPSMETTVKLADIFDVTLDYLYGRNQTPQWATKKDSLDLKDYIEGNLVSGMTYDGENLTDDENERVKLAMIQVFWDKRKKERERRNVNGNNKRLK